jgi:hypothetical protein
LREDFRGPALPLLAVSGLLDPGDVPEFMLRSALQARPAQRLALSSQAL